MHINPVSFLRTLLIPAACFLITIILPISEISALSNEEYDKLQNELKKKSMNEI